jgi:hypothetical protein
MRRQIPAWKKPGKRRLAAAWLKLKTAKSRAFLAMKSQHASAESSAGEKHVFHPEAEREYTDAASYYFKINPDLSVRFYDEIERLILEARTQQGRF